MLTDFEDLTLQILAVFKSRHRDGYFKVDARPYAALSLRLGGTGVFTIDGKQLTVGAGDVFYIPAGMSYEVEYSDNEIMVAHLSACNYTVPEVIGIKNPSVVESQFVRLMDSWKNHGSPHLVKSQMYALLDTVAVENAALSDDSAASRYVRYMEEHFHEPDLDVGTVCRELFVSRSTLQRVFLNRFGMTPRQYLIGLRVDHALKLLAEGSMKVREVAEACGFSDEKYFSVVFKKAYGFPPSRLINHMIE